MFSILNGKDDSPLNLVIDENFKHLSIPICQHLCKRQENLVLFCFQHPPEYYEESITNFKDRCGVYDGFSDPLNWLNQDQNSNETSTLSTIKEKIELMKKDPSARTIVIIDDGQMFFRSANFMTSNGEFNWAPNILHHLSKDLQVWCFVNSDLFTEDQMTELCFVSTMHVTFTFECYKPSLKYKYECISKQKLKMDKLESSALEINEDGTMRQSRLTQPNPSRARDKESDEPDPTANLTFNLRLTENEKEARSKVQLPYLLSDAQKEKYLNQTRRHISIGGKEDSLGASGGGDIIYEPDDADDFDDEDPDDDLDF